MTIPLDDVDIQLLTALQEDADRTNVELARMTGLSPAATLHRVRRLKETGVIRVIRAEVDPAAAGFPLKLYVTASLARHDPRSSRVFDDLIRSLPQIIAADNVAGETDYLLSVVARDVSELQGVLASLATRGGQHGLQFGDVAGDDGEEVVGLARHVVCRDDLRQGADHVIEHVAGARVVPGQRGGDVHLQREAGRGRVDLGADHPDDARLLQPPDPVQRGGRRQARHPGEFDVGAVRVLLQHGEQLDVNIVKFNGHIAEYYLVDSVSRRTLYSYRRVWMHEHQPP